MENQTSQDDYSNSEYSSDRIDISDENALEGYEERIIETPEREMDEPPRYARTDLGFHISELPPQERQNLYKWLKNFSFVKTILFFMFVVYIIDLFCTKGQSSLKEPFFEVLKTLLLTVSGYVFAKSGKD